MKGGDRKDPVFVGMPHETVGNRFPISYLGNWYHQRGGTPRL